MLLLLRVNSEEFEEGSILYGHCKLSRLKYRDGIYCCTALGNTTNADLDSCTTRIRLVSYSH